MANKQTVLKQYRDLARNIESFTDGQASLKELIDSDSLDEIYVTLNIKKGMYRGASIDFQLETTDFPDTAPNVTCLTKVYHPNIEFYDLEAGEICLNLFDELWTSEITLVDVVQALLFLFYHPNTEDPLNSLFCGKETEEEFERDVRMSLKGEYLSEYDYPRILPDDYESDNENESTAEDEPDTNNTSLLQDAGDIVVGQDAEVNNENAAEEVELDTNDTTLLKTASDDVVCEASAVTDEKKPSSSNFEVSQETPTTLTKPASPQLIQYTHYKVLSVIAAFVHNAMGTFFAKPVAPQPTFVESSVDVDVR